MLFFKDILSEKLKDEGFKKIYEQECHICRTILRLVSRLEKDACLLSVLKAHQLSLQDWENIRQGDHCIPEKVFSLCETLGLEAADSMENCPRLG